MAVPTNIYSSFDAIGGREDLTDVISNIAPVETYLTNAIGKATATNRTHEWQTDVLKAPSANAWIESDEFTASARTATTRLNNYCQIVREDFVISDRLEILGKAGRQSEIAYQIQKAMKELANDIEYALLINTSAVTGSESVAGTMKGLRGWITTNVTTNSPDAEVTAGMINSSIATLWAAGGKPPYKAICGMFQKRKLSSALSNLNTRDISAKEKTVTHAVDVYETDGGLLEIIPHHIMDSSAPSEIIILGDINLWKKAWLRNVEIKKLADLPDAKPIVIKADLTLEARNELGSAKITGLTTS